MESDKISSGVNPREQKNDDKKANDDTRIPRANVDADGHCTVPAYAEATRFNTGDACIDGLNWPSAGDDVPISEQDGSVEQKPERI